jgi:hypothetical protein
MGRLSSVVSSILSFKRTLKFCEERQDIISLCLLVVSYEMDIKEYEKIMTSNEAKKKTIEEFMDS